MPVSDWLPRPRVCLFICWLQGICTLGVVHLRRVVTHITSGVYERVHSISRRTLYYISDIFFFVLEFFFPFKRINMTLCNGRWFAMLCTEYQFLVYILCIPRLFPPTNIFGHLELAIVCAIFVSQEITIDYYYLWISHILFRERSTYFAIPKVKNTAD